jgi:hypothetical protein
MAIQKERRILYFIADSSPTAEETQAAGKLNTRRFRNVSLYQEDSALEPCDAVAGLAPKAYLAKFPRADAGEAKAPEAKGIELSAPQADPKGPAKK